MHVSTVTDAHEVFGKSRGCLDRRQRSVNLVIFKRRHFRTKLVDDVEKLTIRMQCEVSWPGAGRKFRKWLFRRSKLSGRTIELVDHQFVDPEISGERESLIPIENHTVRV